MSLIFDQFKSREHADKFALDVKQRFGLGTQVFTTEEEAFQHDPFPFDLQAPIVHVDRSEDAGVERYVERWATHYGGVFAGT